VRTWIGDRGSEIRSKETLSWCDERSASCPSSHPAAPRRSHELELVHRLHGAGLPFLAGTDTPAGVDVIPGVSLHHELGRFVDAGFTPLEALQTATINPARFLGRLADLGTVERGKLADLVILDRDPLADIASTRAIAAVVAAGRYLSRDDLDGILRDVAAAAARMR
jgi:imidazolonepropionase-like amidohydrolase